MAIAACCINMVFGKSNLYTGWKQKFDNEPYPDLTAQVGDTITFIWTVDDIQNVFIHPTNSCTQTGRIAVGNVSPTEYTFKPEDGAPGGKTIFFANDIGDRCENFGMRLIVTVFPDSDGGEIPDVNLTPEPFPSVAPTEAPVLFTSPPTLAPVAPSNAPVFPTAFPTVAPILPTQAPISPTDAPTRSPSRQPSHSPTLLRTPPPTNSPTFSPTIPLVMATSFPTKTPTHAPTGAPITAPTFYPTTPPTETTVSKETEVPTEDSNSDLQRIKLRGLQMKLTGIDSLSGNAMEGWAEATAAFCTSHYANDYVSATFRTEIGVTNVLEPSSPGRSMRGLERNLQGDDVIVTYNQVVSYSKVGDAEITEEYLAKSPFDSFDKRSNFVEKLQSSNDPLLVAVTGASAVTFADEIVPTSAPVDVQPVPAVPDKKEIADQKFSLPLTAIIGIACGVGALMIITILFCIYCKAKKSQDKSARDPNPPPANVAIKADEVSTLAGPSIPGNSPMYGDRSIGTVDYDYSKAYEDRDHSVSYAGGTLGSDTQDYSFPANAGATGAALGPYDDDGSFGDHFGKSKVKVQEEVLHIFAPPGKLGVVIDTPDDGAPVVHAVKETSVVVDKVKVGDKLLAVDDEDVRTLTAIKVSKLISRKSANPSRKLTILRITPMG